MDLLQLQGDSSSLYFAMTYIDCCRQNGPQVTILSGEKQGCERAAGPSLHPLSQLFRHRDPYASCNFDTEVTGERVAVGGQFSERDYEVEIPRVEKQRQTKGVTIGTMSNRIKLLRPVTGRPIQKLILRETVRIVTIWHRQTFPFSSYIRRCN
ncbi:MAG: hypothetical protein ACI9HK_000778 [Pirellulaceae bacterium]|jgi:hypothetical protein